MNAQPPAKPADATRPEDTTIIFSEEDIQRTLKRLAHELLEANQGAQDIVLVGLVTRGKYLAQRLVKLIQEFDGKTVPMGVLDITLYRDDSVKTFKSTTESMIPVDITGKHVILVDDVIFRGRTVRAALDALNDYGRPASVQLLVLLDRGHRELPISPNFVGKNIPTSPKERVNVQLQEVDGRDQVTLSR
jgi:pyrimidine operon attenuation protein/uracil phosphoribosyltransferase